MKRPGYMKFVAQGGDWGAIVTELMGVQVLPELLGIHTNMPISVFTAAEGSASVPLTSNAHIAVTITSRLIRLLIIRFSLCVRVPLSLRDRLRLSASRGRCSTIVSPPFVAIHRTQLNAIISRQNDPNML